MALGAQYCTKSSETRLAELVGGLRASRLESWTAEQMHELAEAILAAGDSFYVRRVLQRLEREEIGLFAARSLLLSPPLLNQL